MARGRRKGHKRSKKGGGKAYIRTHRMKGKKGRKGRKRAKK